MQEDIRWKQRFLNYNKALDLLSQAIRQETLTELEQEGMIQRFEYTYELGWNVLKDYLDYAGIQSIIGSRDAIQEAFKRGLISDGTVWMDMFKDRNRTSHTYNKEVAEDIVGHIRSRYVNALSGLRERMAILPQ
ncbi:nucleotidyltransferase substrate binding protein [soil metagenome]